MSKNFQQQSCRAIHYTYIERFNVLTGDDRVPVKFGPKGTDPQ